MPMSFSSVLLAIFIVLKLTGVIAWSWWWVTAPVWGSLVLALLFIGVIATTTFLQQ